MGFIKEWQDKLGVKIVCSQVGRSAAGRANGMVLTESQSSGSHDSLACMCTGPDVDIACQNDTQPLFYSSHAAPPYGDAMVAWWWHHMVARHAWRVLKGCTVSHTQCRHVCWGLCCAGD